MSLNLIDPSEWEGGEVQFFHCLEQKDPDVVYRAAKGSGVVFCGCDRNIHAVTGVTKGFRLCLLVRGRLLN
jgi:hypothetical protein